MDILEKIKISRPSRVLSQGFSIIQSIALVTLLTELSRLRLDIVPLQSSSLEQLTLLTYFGSCIDLMPTQVISTV